VIALAYRQGSWNDRSTGAEGRDYVGMVEISGAKPKFFKESSLA